MAHRQKDQGQFTVQAEVGPGDVTGVYHITFCNLPFDASWQQVKDWIRPRCAVDRVEVFPSSTSGWVRLRGRDNFEAAWDVLNGGSFHGRALIASDRNKTESIKIKELLDFSPDSVRDRRRSAKAPLTQPTSPTQCGSPVSTIMTPQSSGGSYAQFHTTSPPQKDNSLNPVLLAYHAAYYSRGNTLPGPVQPGPVQYAVRQQGPPASQVEAPRSAPEDAGDHHKILLKNIPHRCGAKDVDLWIRRKLNSAQKAINGVEIPIDESGIHSRGHAYVRLNNFVDPTHVVKKLHQHTFRGRTILASVLLDGPDTMMRKPSQESKASGSQKPSGSSHQQRPSSNKAPGNGPLVVEGSAQKGKTRPY